MANLDLSTVELVSTLRAAPMNGSPSSQDYNDSWTEALADLAALAGFVDDILIPMLNGLISTIQPNPNAAPNGLEGRFIYADTTDSSQVFYNNLSNTSNSIADALRVIQGIIDTVQTSINNLSIEVTALQTALSSTNQNDVSQALQNFAAALQALTAQTVANTQAIAAISLTLFTNGVPNGTQNILNLVEGTGIILTPSAGGVVTVATTLVVPEFEIGGTPASSQTVQNLIAGSGVSIVDGGSGNITIASTGVTSLAGLTGDITLTSSDSSVIITPSGSNIDLMAVGGTGSALPGGPTGSVQYNNSGVFAGDAGIAVNYSNPGCKLWVQDGGFDASLGVGGNVYGSDIQDWYINGHTGSGDIQVDKYANLILAAGYLQPQRGIKDGNTSLGTDGQVLTKVTIGIYPSVAWADGLIVVSSPAHTGSTGATNQVAYDGTYLYICTAPNTWGRVLLDYSF